MGKPEFEAHVLYPTRAGQGNVRPGGQMRHAKHLNVAGELRLKFLTSYFEIGNMLEIQKISALDENDSEILLLLEI